jgi:hypothetical protein
MSQSLQGIKPTASKIYSSRTSVVLNGNTPEGVILNGRRTRKIRSDLSFKLHNKRRDVSIRQSYMEHDRILCTSRRTFNSKTGKEGKIETL